MALAQKKQFRIELLNRPNTYAGTHDDDSDDNSGRSRQYDAILEALKNIDQKLGTGATAQGSSPRLEDIERRENELNEQRIKIEKELNEQVQKSNAVREQIESISKNIDDTKREISTLYYNAGENGIEMKRVSDELDAIVQGTESATETILEAVEDIDTLATSLTSKLEGQDLGAANDIQDLVVKIFEACNFQDITGQRIAKIIRTLKFIEGRIDAMSEIWGGEALLDEYNPDTIKQKTGDAALLHGPSLSTEEGLVSQNDIDAMFD